MQQAGSWRVDTSRRGFADLAAMLLTASIGMARLLPSGAGRPASAGPTTSPGVKAGIAVKRECPGAVSPGWAGDDPAHQRLYGRISPAGNISVFDLTCHPVGVMVLPTGAARPSKGTPVLVGA